MFGLFEKRKVRGDVDQLRSQALDIAAAKDEDIYFWRNLTVAITHAFDIETRELAESAPPEDIPKWKVTLDMVDRVQRISDELDQRNSMMQRFEETFDLMDLSRDLVIGASHIWWSGLREGSLALVQTDFPAACEKYRTGMEKARKALQRMAKEWEVEDPKFLLPM